MSNKEEFHWDDDKSDLLKKTRGFSLIEVAEVLFDREYVEYMHAGYPEQTRAIGKVHRRIITLVYELIEDNYSCYTKLITYWDASPLEKKIYKERINNVLD